MITEWFLSLVQGVVDWLAALMPDWEVPAELLDPGGIIQQVMGYGASLGIFVDWGFIIAVGLIPLGVWTIGLIFRGIKSLVSHIPFFGGN